MWKYSLWIYRSLKKPLRFPRIPRNLQEFPGVPRNPQKSQGILTFSHEFTNPQESKRVVPYSIFRMQRVTVKERIVDVNFFEKWKWNILKSIWLELKPFSASSLLLCRGFCREKAVPILFQIEQIPLFFDWIPCKSHPKVHKLSRTFTILPRRTFKPRSSYNQCDLKWPTRKWSFCKHTK